MPSPHEGPNFGKSATEQRLDQLIVYLEEVILAAIDDLRASVAALKGEADTIDTKVTALLANPPTVTGTSDADIASVITDINAVGTQLTATAAKLP